MELLVQIIFAIEEIFFEFLGQTNAQIKSNLLKVIIIALFAFLVFELLWVSLR